MYDKSEESDDNGKRVLRKVGTGYTFIRIYDVTPFTVTAWKTSDVISLVFLVWFLLPLILQQSDTE
jgi:hypothetical protein